MGELIVIVPIAIVQVGWVMVRVGADGMLDAALMVITVAGEIHPAVLWAVML